MKNPPNLEGLFKLRHQRERVAKVIFMGFVASGPMRV